MKAIFKGNKFAIQWTIKDAVTSLPFDFTGMFVEYILYSDSYKGRIVGATTNINKMQAEIPANILPVGVYNIICKYRNSINEGHCIYRNAFQITRNTEFIGCDNIVVIESFSAPLKLENMDINYLGHFTSSNLLIDCNQPSWALVGKLNEAEPWFFYTEDAIPAGSQYGWNNMSDILGKYNLLTSSKEVYHTTLFDRFTSYQQIDGASVTKEDTKEINNIIEAIKTNKSVSFYYNPSKTTFNYFGTLDCYFNETETEFGCYIPTEDGYVVARCNLSNPNQWSLVRGKSTGEGTSVTNYNQLKERPSINGVTLTGNHNPAELDLATVTQFNQVKDISNHALDVSNQSDRKSDTAVNTANQADTKADEAINTAEEAKSTAELAKIAVRTLEGLANATEAQQVLAAQVVQIEENKQNIASNKDETDEKITELASNLHNKTAIPIAIEHTQSLIQKDGAIISSSAYGDSVSELVSVTPNTEYYVSGSCWFGNLVYAFYDSSQTFISGFASNAGEEITNIIDKEIISPSNAAYIRIAETGGLTGNAGQKVGLNTKENKFDNINKEIESVQNDINSIEKNVNELNIQLFTVEKSVVNITYKGNNLFIDKTTGLVAESPAWADSVTNEISITPNATYYISGSSWYSHKIYAFYKEDGSYIDGFSSNAGEEVTSIVNKEVVAPSNAAFLVISQSGGNTGNEGQTISLVEEVKKAKVDILEDTVDDIESKIFETKDILIPVTIEHTQSLIQKGGSIISSSAYGDSVSELVSVTPNTEYYVSGSCWFGHLIYAFYDSSQTFISGFASNAGEEITNVIDREIIVPSNAAYIRIAETGGLTGNAGQKVGLIEKDRAFLKNSFTLQGRKWAVLGDSLTEVNIRTTKHYHTYINEETGISVVNLGRSGTGYANLQYQNLAFYQRTDSIPTDSDVVTVFGSFNDLSAGLEIGTITDSGTDTLCGCINKTINNIQSRMPTVHLGIITPTPWAGYPPTVNENSLAENYVEAIKKICRFRSIPCLDLYRQSNLRPWDKDFRELAYSKDDGGGVHPDETGHKLIAGRIKEFVISLI